MKFFNINNPADIVSLKEAVLRSVRDFGDLYMPERIPLLSNTFINSLYGRELHDIAVNVTEAMLGEELPRQAIETIVSEALTFPIPLKQIADDIHVLELFHGPTLAFKDVGARFMASLLRYLLKNENKEIIILAATSGDTGSAVASAFFNIEGISVVILYPSGKVSPVQEKQLTTMGANITALEVEGSFDDCQSLVKKAFSDSELNRRLRLTSANSINFGRLFPQSFYYFYAVSQVKKNRAPLVFSVPSGNFGNLTSGLMARKMGLPAAVFIAATNINKSVPEYLRSGKFAPQLTKQTLTNAMDVGNPGNFPRIQSLYSGDFDAITKDLHGYWFTDDHTLNGMKELYEKYSYVADPHGAVAWLGLKEYMKSDGCTGIFLETAHPVKFSETVKSAIGENIEIPDRLKAVLSKKKQSLSMENDYSCLRDLLSSGLRRQAW